MQKHIVLLLQFGPAQSSNTKTDAESHDATAASMDIAMSRHVVARRGAKGCGSAILALNRCGWGYVRYLPRADRINTSVEIALIQSFKV